jgi:2-keto-4-pentenoate hydratase
LTSVWLDPRVAAGMEKQLALRDQRTSAGDRTRGWKVAFGAPAAMANLGIEGPLVGFFTSGALLAPGASVPLGEWTKPALEPEIAIHMSAELPGGADHETAAAAIGGLGAAIELADLDLPLDDLEAVVAGDIFQRHVILGPVDRSRAGGDADGVTAIIHRNGAVDSTEDDPCSVVGNLVDVTRHVADHLAACGAHLSAGDVIISGSVVPLLWVSAGEAVSCEIAPLGTLDVHFTD